MSKIQTNGFTLKIIAITAMLIDHIGAVLYPNILLLRLLGRLTMPIIAYMIAEGYHYTSNRKKYLLRLTVFGFVSQFPFMWAFGVNRLNVMFTLALSVLLLMVNQSEKQEYLKVLVSAGIFLVSFWCDWSFIGVLFVMVFYYYRGSFKRQALGFAAVTLAMILYYSVSATGPTYLINLGVLGALPLLYIYNGKRGFNIKYFFYIFYPAHLLVLALISRI